MRRCRMLKYAGFIGDELEDRAFDIGFEPELVQIAECDLGASTPRCHSDEGQ